MLTLNDEIKIRELDAKDKIKLTLSNVPKTTWAIYLGIVILLSFGYAITKKLALSYYEKYYLNYTVTAKTSFGTPKEISAGKVELIKIGENLYSAVVEVRNDNLGIALKTGAGTFKIYDGMKNLILSEKKYFSLEPDQKTYLVLPKIQAINPALVGIDFSELVWQKPPQIPVVKLITSLPYIHSQESPQMLVVEGSVQNESAYRLGKVTLTIFVYNADKKIVAFSQRDEFNIVSSERRAFKQLWPGILFNDEYTAKVFAKTDTLNKSNLTIPSMGNGSSDLGRPENNPQ
jgi:hypothetical protein